jgi:hypothetical protein
VQVQADRGVLLEKVRQDRRERRLGERHRAAGADRAARLRARELHRLECRVRLGEHRGGVSIDLMPYLGHRKAPRRAVQQSHVELRFERHDVA